MSLNNNSITSSTVPKHLLDVQNKIFLSIIFKLISFLYVLYFFKVRYDRRFQYRLNVFKEQKKKKKKKKKFKARKLVPNKWVVTTLSLTTLVFFLSWKGKIIIGGLVETFTPPVFQRM